MNLVSCLNAGVKRKRHPMRNNYIYIVDMHVVQTIIVKNYR